MNKHWFVGEFVKARDHLERALALFQPGRDDDLAYRFGHDAGVGAMSYLAHALWPLGEVDRAISLIGPPCRRGWLRSRMATRSPSGTCSRRNLH